MNKTDLIRQAVIKAARLRSSCHINPNEGLCPYDLAIKLGVKVFLRSIPSLEGMYSPEPTLAIIIGSERPAGRRRYTCAHEIGHHVFGHGAKIDELEVSNSSPVSSDELVAQTFAGALLMPMLAIKSAFNRRGWKIENVHPLQYFIISQELGVGYSALITHIEIHSSVLSRQMGDDLRRKSLKSIRFELARFDIEHDLFVVDKEWNRQSIDVETGDVIILPNGVDMKSSRVESLSGERACYKATSPGVYKIQISPSKNVLLRVSRRNFSGLARYRHLEEV